MDLSSQRQYIQRARNVTVDLTTTSETLLYTAPSGDDFDFVVIESILVTEDGGQQTQIDVTNTHGSDTFNLFSGKVISANSTSELLERPIIIHADEIIKVQGNHAGNLDIHMSIVEYAKGD